MSSSPSSLVYSYNSYVPAWMRDIGNYEPGKDSGDLFWRNRPALIGEHVWEVYEVMITEFLDVKLHCK